MVHSPVTAGSVPSSLAVPGVALPQGRTDQMGTMTPMESAFTKVTLPTDREPRDQLACIFPFAFRTLTAIRIATGSDLLKIGFAAQTMKLK